ncbi:putative membrane protein [Wickerhamomyces ciferrii]|uniref:Membrane protein n=1 Tax=Wickerhamomyces ciferrii (strain ATCC 14091 / BCRC 22168 / CBS 111 / JCM 3599 / NBRC 0793 / NRRL Y-1031 F-60-10) TaxID=1206466 RepID=K0KPH5_WICCF|nr:uncharacterized protein BN7_6780 [Wickerhamomyces ciferrii]CCH47160.1 putative membrane protein [Wickerhamomyces ciferrii]
MLLLHLDELPSKDDMIEYLKEIFTEISSGFVFIINVCFVYTGGIIWEYILKFVWDFVFIDVGRDIIWRFLGKYIWLYFLKKLLLVLIFSVLVFLLQIWYLLKEAAANLLKLFDFIWKFIKKSIFKAENLTKLMVFIYHFNFFLSNLGILGFTGGLIILRFGVKKDERELETNYSKSFDLRCSKYKEAVVLKLNSLYNTNETMDLTLLWKSSQDFNNLTKHEENMCFNPTIRKKPNESEEVVKMNFTKLPEFSFNLKTVHGKVQTLEGFMWAGFLYSSFIAITCWSFLLAAKDDRGYSERRFSAQIIAMIIGAALIFYWMLN